MPDRNTGRCASCPSPSPRVRRPSPRGMVVKTQHTSEVGGSRPAWRHGVPAHQPPAGLPGLRGGECPQNHRRLRVVAVPLHGRQADLQPLRLTSRSCADGCIPCQRCVRFGKEISGDVSADFAGPRRRHRPHGPPLLGGFDTTTLNTSSTRWPRTPRPVRRPVRHGRDRWGRPTRASCPSPERAACRVAPSRLTSGNIIQIVPVGARPPRPTLPRAPSTWFHGLRSRSTTCRAALIRQTCRGEVVRRAERQRPRSTKSGSPTSDRFAFEWDKAGSPDLPCRAREWRAGSHPSWSDVADRVREGLSRRVRPLASLPGGRLTFEDAWGLVEVRLHRRRF